LFRWNIEGGGLFLSVFRLDFPISLFRSPHLGRVFAKNRARIFKPS
jgi:hypothetical protein